MVSLRDVSVRYGGNLVISVVASVGLGVMGARLFITTTVLNTQRRAGVASNSAKNKHV